MSHVQDAHTTSLDEVDLEEAVGDANVPTLLMLLVHLTGDMRWLSDDFRISRPAGISDNDTGGLCAERQAEIRAAAGEAIRAHLEEGRVPALQDPTPQQLIEMLEFSIGESIPAEYGPMIKDDMRAAGLLDRSAEGMAAGDPTGAVPPGMRRPPEGFKVCVIGGGISGLSAAMALETAGIDYVILEKHGVVGGSWYENRYPGAGVDTPSHLYSWPGIAHDWKQYFSLRDDVFEYLQRVARERVPDEKLRLHTEVRRAAFDESAGHWVVEYEGPGGTASSERFNVVISAVGLFNTPSTPTIPGQSSFAGRSFHTAEWPTDIDLSGLRVGVIGNGASAMQVVPAIVSRVASLTIFQRTPQWVAPFEKFHMEVPPAVRSLIARVPAYRWWYRVRLMWMFNDRFWRHLEVDPEWPRPDQAINRTNDRIRIAFTEYIEEQLDGRPDLIAKTVPNYPPYTKRILFDNGWYAALRQPNVTLVTEGVEQLTDEGVVSMSGEKFPLDVVVYATGFNAVKFLSTFELYGSGGRRLRDVWGEDDAKAYLGTAVPGFPNFFCLYGPNLQAGHGGSFMTTAAAQVNYIMTMLDQMFAHGIDVVDCREAVCEEYNERVDEANATRIWTHPGTHNYYRNSRGRVVVNRAFKNLDFWQWTRSADLDDYHVRSIEHPHARGRATEANP